MPAGLWAPSYSPDTTLPPIWDYNEVGTVVGGGWQPHFLRVPIPGHSALIGMLYSVQSYRLQESTIWASDEAVFFIG